MRPCGVHGGRGESSYTVTVRASVLSRGLDTGAEAKVCSDLQELQARRGQAHLAWPLARK